jgi:hypothetical protein
MDTTKVMICDCGLPVTTWNGGGIVTHNKSKTHEMHLKYKDIIIDGKITCIPCNTTVKVMSCGLHLESSAHKLGLRKGEKIICECGETISSLYLNKHIKSKRHIMLQRINYMLKMIK